MSAYADNLSPAILAMDTQFIILSMDEKMEKLTGFTRAEAIGRPCHELICRREVQGCPIFMAIKEGKVSSLTHWLKMNTKSSKGIYALARGLWILGAERSPLGIVELFWPQPQGAHIQEGSMPLYLKIEHPSIRRIREQIECLSRGASPVLLSGEEGLQMGRMARMIHLLSPRSQGPFLELNCGAFRERMLEVELFGSIADPPQGDHGGRRGRIICASGGTLHLESIENLPSTLQAKLIRYLDQGEVEPPGEMRPQYPDTRIIASCKADPQELIQRGRLIEALYLRLRPFEIKLPPVRELSVGIPGWVEIILQRLHAMYGKGLEAPSQEAMNALMSFDFPGNVRELENVLHFAYLRSQDGRITLSTLPAYIHRQQDSSIKHDPRSMEEMEREVILQALARNNWNRKKTAQDLGIDRTTLWRKMKKMGWGSRMRPV
jgi:DNA-binding NtrC family response regulator